MALDLGQPCGPTRSRCGHFGKALGKDPALASAGRAAEPPRLDAQGDDLSLPRQVGQGPLVMAMHARGRRATARADGGQRLRAGENDDAVKPGKDLLDEQALRDHGQEMGEQLGTE